MAAVTTLRVKVPSKESLEFFMAHWDKSKMPVVDGEFTIPEKRRYMEIDPLRVSHGIQNIKTDTYDPNTNSVAMDVLFFGPMSKPAIDAYVKGDIRLIPRCIKAIPPGGKEKDAVERIITWDLAHRPKDDDGLLHQRLEEERLKMRAEANAKDKATELAKKKIKK